MKFAQSVFQIGVAVTVLIPSVAFADVYDWTFGGGSDSVSGAGTLTATAVGGYTNLYNIISGSGTVTDSAGTFNVTILPLSAGNGSPNPCGNITPVLPCSTLQNPPGSGGVNVTYDNLLYFPAPGASQLDANGIILYNQAGPQSESYFDVWSAASSGNPLPDNFYNTVTGANTNLTNQFTVSPTVPEPSYGFLALGLLGAVAGVRRWKNRVV